MLGWLRLGGRLGRRRYALVAAPILAVGYLVLGVAGGPVVAAALLLPATVRRLRDAGVRPWLAALLLLPLVNLVVVAIAAALPPRDARARLEVAWPAALTSAGGAAALAAGVAVALTFLGGNVWEEYGFGLFLGVPFVLGVVAAALYGARRQRDVGSSVVVALVAAVLASAALIAFALEGAICLIMALPITLPLAALGGVAGWALTQRRGGPAAEAVCAAVLVLPLAMGAEAVVPREPELVAVRTSVVVAAPPEVVWRHVVAVESLPPPTDVVFRLGIAHPTRATIEGTGVGAVRRCTFSTGDFVEPITVWDEPRRLAFDVVEQPPPMRELSPWADVRPPHLDGFLVSERGEFRLTPLPGGGTLLTGMTWYRNRMWPAAYWQVWSDALIHRIHTRVLAHVAELSERAAAAED